jgi:hypothetical protein
VSERIAVYVEVGAKRAFAGALEWPGWCRGGRDGDAALAALAAYGERYGTSMGEAARGFVVPASPSALEVVEQLEGDATTDFGAPSRAPSVDGRPVDGPAFERLLALLQASWAAFDRAAASAVGVELRKGPRGGGRELDAIVAHVTDADGGYLRRIEGVYRTAPGASDPVVRANGMREAIIRTLSARRRGEAPEKPRRSGAVWTTPYFVRRSAWHALDHAWEIEDRSAR